MERLSSLNNQLTSKSKTYRYTVDGGCLTQ